MIKAEASGRPFLFPVPSHKPKDRWLRHISRKHAARYRFGQLSELQRLVLAQTVTAAAGRLAYIKNCKCGCTTVMNLLYRLDHGRDFDGDVHHAMIGFRAGIEQWPALMQALRQGVSFSIARHPERRIVSAFFDFFVTRRNGEAQNHLGPIEAFGFSEKADQGYRFDVFLDYVAAGISASLLETEPHWQPQHVTLGHGEFVLSHIGQLETLDRDLRIVGDMAGVALAQTNSLPDARQNRSGSGEFVPSAEQRRKIAALYALDYELYGYKAAAGN